MAFLFSVLTLIFLVNLGVRAAKDNGFLDAGFQFDYTSSGVAVPIPTTTQCDEIPLSWGRADFTDGGNPQAPYYIQVYTSTFLFPSIINVGSGLSYNWPVPYTPGTQYQICMFANNGVSGGCQRMTTVVPVANLSTDDSPTCTNLTYPQGILDVAAYDHTGNLSQYGWVDQCTDIMIQPLNGTPPFILTVAATLHPPWNLTSDDMSPINWTVQLSWASSFFISLVDSTGMTWAFGPLHSGGEGPTKCLAIGEVDDDGVSKGVVAGASVGALAAGIAIGAIGIFFFLRRRQKRGPFYDNYPSDRIRSYGHGNDGKKSPLETDAYAPLPGSASLQELNAPPTGRSMLLAGTEYEVEPFMVPTTANSGDNVPAGNPTVHSHGSQSWSRSADVSESSNSGPQTSGSPERNLSSSSGQVYVVHHDGGRAPVTVYTAKGTEVIELPPRYDTSSPHGQLQLEERRRLGPRPMKSPRQSSSNVVNS